MKHQGKERFTCKICVVITADSPFFGKSLWSRVVFTGKYIVCMPAFTRNPCEIYVNQPRRFTHTPCYLLGYVRKVYSPP